MRPTLFEENRNCAKRCLRRNFPLNMLMINFRAAIKNLVGKVRTFSLTLAQMNIGVELERAGRKKEAVELLEKEVEQFRHEVNWSRGEQEKYQTHPLFQKRLIAK